MRENSFFKLLCSIPIILVTLYFIPFLGVCLILFRYYLYKEQKYYTVPVSIFVMGLVLLIPKEVDFILKVFKLDSLKIQYLDIIINSDIYIKLLQYSKLLITIGVIFLILIFMFRNVFNKVNSKLNFSIRNYIEQDLQKDYKIRKENDLKMQEKREKSKNTHVIHCPYCGSDNILTEQTGTCRFCRRNIENSDL